MKKIMWFPVTFATLFLLNRFFLYEIGKFIVGPSYFFIFTFISSTVNISISVDVHKDINTKISFLRYFRINS